MSEPIVDLRSDTVTRPTPAMRDAIRNAEVGDDVYGDDPTVLALERRIAMLTGYEAALYVPSGTMGNQLAVNSHTQPGDEVLLDAESHLFLYEQGGIAANSGCLAHIVRGTRGVLPIEAIEAALREPDEHVARVTLVCIENTHNRAGGAIVPLDVQRRVTVCARARGLRVHMDGARLWNASVATGVPIAEWAATADSVMMCFSKGLGAPVGSILAGVRRSSIARAGPASAGAEACARSASLQRPACTRSTITSTGCGRTMCAHGGWRRACGMRRACGWRSPTPTS